MLAHALNDHGDGTRSGDKGLAMQCQNLQQVTASFLDFGIRSTLSRCLNNNWDGTRICDDVLVVEVLCDQVG